MEEQNFDAYSDIFKALSHPLRLKIVFGLTQKQECNVSKMVESLEVPQPTVSQHLNILKMHGIIEGFRKGNQICYKVTNEQVKKIIDTFEEGSCEC